MVKPLRAALSFERLAIAATVAVVSALYFLVMTGQPWASFAAKPVPVAPERTQRPAPRIEWKAPPTGKPAVDTSRKLARLFDDLNYQLDAVRTTGEVPRLLLASLPSDLPEIPLPDQRKLMFLKAALPLVLEVNEKILRDREKIQAMARKLRAGAAPTSFEKAWMDTIAEAYGAETADVPALLSRVDTVPPSLALAQAAEESGWGTSRFAHEGNALFGQREFNGTGGLVPVAREAGEQFTVSSFDDLVASVRAYMRNLNSHAAYTDFRKQRAAMRAKGQVLDGYALAASLKSYSQRGKHYVVSLRRIIRINELRGLDRARLNRNLPIAPIEAELAASQMDAQL